MEETPDDREQHALDRAFAKALYGDYLRAVTEAALQGLLEHYVEANAGH